MVEMDKNLNVWRDYQRRLDKNARRHRYRRVLPLLGFAAGIGLIVLIIVCFSGQWIFAHLGQPGWENPGTEEEFQEPLQLSKPAVPSLLVGGTERIFPLEQKYYVQNSGSMLEVETSIDGDLQQFVRQLIDRSFTYKTAVVVMRSDNGQILALANHAGPQEETHDNLCLRAEFPAASLFKIVAAAAAIEARGFTPDTTLPFRGQKHTLYKSQLRSYKDKYATRMTLKEAFSDSVNPFFGKLGIHYLGRNVMAEYAERFLFNQPIPFDLPVSISSIDLPHDDYGLAEIASGFNRRTLISPLHAALLTAAVANNGMMMAPWLVKTIKDESGKILYQGEPTKLASPITEGTAKELRTLMQETVIAGTCRKAFRPLRRKNFMRDLVIGAKTGTINDQLGEHKCEWLALFALPDNGEPGLSMAILTVHGDRLGLRAKDIARYIINRQFG